MKRHSVPITILSVLFLITAGATTLHAHTRAGLHDQMRELWIDHAAWTRMYILSAAANSPDTAVTAQRLLRNQDDIGNAVAHFYGPAAGQQLTALLKDHILIAAELVEAAKAGDSTRIAIAQTLWYQNADDISTFLHQANPKYWPEEDLKAMMRMHLDQTLAEAVHRLQGQYEADIRDYDEIVHHLIMMADMLSEGIIKQFPEKFNHAGGNDGGHH